LEEIPLVAKASSFVFNVVATLLLLSIYGNKLLDEVIIEITFKG
jgi:hypothetical protein